MNTQWLQEFGRTCIQRKEDVFAVGEERKLRSLDEHQSEAMEALARSVDERRRAVSIIHSTGSGKTTLEANILGASLEAKQAAQLKGERKDILITTERALMQGIRDELTSLGLDVGIWGIGMKQVDHPVVLASIQALQRNADSLEKQLPLNRIDMVIGDEADVYLTEKRAEVVRKFNRAFRIGLTATETWPDGRTVSDVWGEKIHELGLDEAILKGVNVPPYFHLFEAKLDAKQLGIKGGDYDQAALEAGMKAAEIEKAIPEVYRTLIPKSKRKDFPTLVYVPSVDLVHVVREKLEREFGGEHVRIGAWTGEISSDELEKDTAAFRVGTMDILVLCEMGGRGLDLVRARCLIDAYPTLSRTKLAQRHGRVLRKVRSESALMQSGYQKPFSIIAQIVPHATNFRPVCFPDLLEDPEAWKDASEGRVLLTERREMNQEEFEHPGRVPLSDIDEVRQWIGKHRKMVHVTKLEEVDIFAKLKQREQLSMADEEGFFELEGKKYATMLTWVDALDIGYYAMEIRLKEQTSILGRCLGGQVANFYAEDVVQDACADLIGLPTADEEGFLEKNGKKYGTTHAWSKALLISSPTIKKRLEKAPFINGKDTAGNSQKFYHEDVVQDACADLIGLPTADEEGFLEKNGKKYGTTESWSRTFNLTPALIKRHLLGTSALKGRDSGGSVRDFYPEDVLREKCANLLQEVPQAGEEGFFEREGKKYATKGTWQTSLTIPGETIKRRLKGVPFVTGKDAGGHIRDFYPEDIVRERCADLIAKKKVR